MVNVRIRDYKVSTTRIHAQFSQSRIARIFEYLNGKHNRKNLMKANIYVYVKSIRQYVVISLFASAIKLHNDNNIVFKRYNEQSSATFISSFLADI